MLTPFDEMPVHQMPYPFSVSASIDVASDDGYSFGVRSDNGPEFTGREFTTHMNAPALGRTRYLTAAAAGC